MKVQSIANIEKISIFDNFIRNVGDSPFLFPSSRHAITSIIQGLQSFKLKKFVDVIDSHLNACRLPQNCQFFGTVLHVLRHWQISKVNGYLLHLCLEVGWNFGPCERSHDNPFIVAAWGIIMSCKIAKSPAHRRTTTCARANYFRLYKNKRREQLGKSHFLDKRAVIVCTELLCRQKHKQWKLPKYGFNQYKTYSQNTSFVCSSGVSLFD